jgi:very-short-patch-repair endonuclease
VTSPLPCKLGTPSPNGEGEGVRETTKKIQMALEEDFHFGASPIIFKRAKELRKSSTEAEKVLWKFLRNRNFHNIKFRRQHPISSYIVDFYCHERILLSKLTEVSIT